MELAKNANEKPFVNDQNRHGGDDESEYVKGKVFISFHFISFKESVETKRILLP